MLALIGASMYARQANPKDPITLSCVIKPEN
jgi:hypothetical protein